jgi:hypothetical protein
LVPSTHIYRTGAGPGHIDVPGTTSEDAPSQFDGRCSFRDIFPQANGDVWVMCSDFGGIFRLRYQGLDGDGDPIYHWSTSDVYPDPPQLPSRTRIEVYGNTVYLSGCASGESCDGGNTWQYVGTRLVKYSSLPTSSGWPAPSWNHTLFKGSGNDLAVSWSVDTSRARVALAYQSGGPDGMPDQGYVRELDTATGADTGKLEWPSAGGGPLGGVGWFDTPRAIVAHDGVQYWEDDWNGKVVGVTP